MCYHLSDYKKQKVMHVRFIFVPVIFIFMHFSVYIISYGAIIIKKQGGIYFILWAVIIV